MSQFKDLIILILYIFLLINIRENADFTVYFLLVATSLIFGIKYLILKNKIRFSGRIIKQYLTNQREVFINSLNHDIRIPVIAQLRILELMNKTLKNSLGGTEKDILCQAELSCRNILNLISLLINTYNTENNNRKLIYKNFNLNDIIYFCIKELNNEASEKNISFEYFEGENNNLIISADKEDIKNVVLNILLSSLINSESNCKIRIKTEQTSNKIRLSVTGKNENNYSDINSNFAAIGQSTRMYFCRKIIELHKGHLLLNHSIPNSFIFELPKSGHCPVQA